ncbi:hypothetical protein R3P38DRAFT_2796162 [Favolaschia claudopus]|uniref:Uncharacterized protein n=1 Tax=Favolaschia claudopus TaxID=2862362 RepID=A0AAW0A5N2_9AGAR
MSPTSTHRAFRSCTWDRNSREDREGGKRVSEVQCGPYAQRECHGLSRVETDDRREASGQKTAKEGADERVETGLCGMRRGRGNAIVTETESSATGNSSSDAVFALEDESLERQLKPDLQNLEGISKLVCAASFSQNIRPPTANAIHHAPFGFSSSRGGNKVLQQVSFDMNHAQPSIGGSEQPRFSIEHDQDSRHEDVEGGS